MELLLFPQMFSEHYPLDFEGTTKYCLLSNVILPQVYLILQSFFSIREQGYVKGREHVSLQGSYAMPGQGLLSTKLKNKITRQCWGKRWAGQNWWFSHLGMVITWVFRLRVLLEAQINYLAKQVLRNRPGYRVLDEYRKALKPWYSFST